MYDIYGEACFNQNNLYKLAKHIYYYECVKKTVHGEKIHWLSSKEKVPGTVVSKEGHAESLLGPII